MSRDEGADTNQRGTESTEIPTSGFHSSVMSNCPERPVLSRIGRPASSSRFATKVLHSCPPVR